MQLRMKQQDSKGLYGISSHLSRRSVSAKPKRPLNVLPSVDVSAFQPPEQFLVALAANCVAGQNLADGLGVATPFEIEQGQAALKELAANYCPEIEQLAAPVPDMSPPNPPCSVLPRLGSA